jgi:hypothetical protein
MVEGCLHIVLMHALATQQLKSVIYIVSEHVVCHIVRHIVGIADPMGMNQNGQAAAALDLLRHPNPLGKLQGIRALRRFY